MTILALETTSSFGSVAIAKDGKLLALSCLDIQVTHSERVMPEIERMRVSLNMEMKDFDCVAISNGPGSFTGVRIGLAAAKGIAMSLKIPLIAVNTLELLAGNVTGGERKILALIDARMGEVYGALYDEKGKAIIEPRCSKPEDFLKQIDVPVIALGSGVDAYKNELDRLNIDFRTVPLHLNNPLASGLVSMVYGLAEIPPYNLDEMSRLEPFYLRKSQAELVRDEKESGA